MAEFHVKPNDVIVLDLKNGHKPRKYSIKRSSSYPWAVLQQTSERP